MDSQYEVLCDDVDFLQFCQSSGMVQSEGLFCNVDLGDAVLPHTMT